MGTKILEQRLLRLCGSHTWLC